MEAASWNNVFSSYFYSKIFQNIQKLNEFYNKYFLLVLAVLGLNSEL
jgi:hypothetical protein